MAVKQVADYVDKVQEKFPFLTKSEINKILSFGLIRFAWINKMHVDVKLFDSKSNKYVAQTGWMPKNALRFFENFITKWRLKERVLFRLKKEEWDGYYYIGLNDTQQAKLAKCKKIKKFKKVYFTKLYKELRHDKRITHIWRVPYPVDSGWRFYVTKYETDKAEYIGENNYEKFHQCFLGRYNHGYAPVNDAVGSIK